jgi:hypothetical protein
LFYGLKYNIKVVVYDGKSNKSGDITNFSFHSFCKGIKGANKKSYSSLGVM